MDYDKRIKELEKEFNDNVLKIQELNKEQERLIGKHELMKSLKEESTKGKDKEEKK